MTYQAPIRDIMFNIEQLSAWQEVASFPAYSGVDRTDAQAALEGFGRFCEEMIAPLSAAGDETGARLDGEDVVMPAPYAQAYKLFTAMGWQSLPHPAEFGGMGLPRAVGAAVLPASRMW